jgi:hypothetical protein
MFQFLFFRQLWVECARTHADVSFGPESATALCSDSPWTNREDRDDDRDALKISVLR